MVYVKYLQKVTNFNNLLSSIISQERFWSVFEHFIKFVVLFQNFQTSSILIFEITK